MIEALKEEVKNFLKEMEEMTNKKLAEINKIPQRKSRKSNQTGERHGSRLKNWNRGNKENIN